jgi:cephalosporin hydroxylase
MSRESIAREFVVQSGMATDMMGYMTILRDLAATHPVIVELGVWDCTSTWAMLGGFPKKLRSYDICHLKPNMPGCPADARDYVSEVEAACVDSGVDFEFIHKSSLEVELEEHDLLFIDTLHTYAQLTAELKMHSGKTRKTIVMHDTSIFGNVDQHGKTPGLWNAIVDFLSTHPEWKLKRRIEDTYGLTILERV